MIPQLVGPKELFADKKVASLCTIISRNAGEHGMVPRDKLQSALQNYMHHNER